ncbi:MAG: hypothetical protein DI566_02050 [Microbacterium sp.]|nr:MAG: hypothetical protein DI566_02050 [Microbacterium sp.]
MRRTVATASVLLAALTLSLTACGTGAAMTESTPSTSASSRPPLKTTTPGPIAPTGTPVEVPEARWDAVVADLAQRGVAGAPELVSAEAVTFSDGSLGCASPGQSYTQALIDGMRVVVTADGRTYDYRFGASDSPTLCTR